MPQSFRGTPSNARSSSVRSTSQQSVSKHADPDRTATPAGSQAGASPAGTPRVGGESFNKLRFQELLSENATLKTRVASLTDELRVTRDISSRMHRTRRVASPPRSRSNGRSGSPGKGGAEVMTFITYKDSDSQTKGVSTKVSGSQTLDTEYLDGSSEEVRRLKAEVLRSHAECASLQHAMQQLRSSILGSDRATDTAEAIEYARRESEEKIQALHNSLLEANSEIKKKHDEIRSLNIQASNPAEGKRIMYHKGIMTDDPLLPTNIPSSGGSSVLGDTGSDLRADEVAILQRALELTKSQLRQTRADLDTARKDALTGTTGTSGSSLSSMKSTENVGVMVDTTYDYEKLFRVYKRPFNPSSVESLLIEAENAAERRTAEQSMKTALNSVVGDENVEDLKKALDNARKDLVEAHEKIDELHYALDLERRERTNFGEGAEGPNARQASAEITFLCDTLAATRTELELLQRKTMEAEAERDAAIASFTDLKGRTQAMFEECQDITESTRRETDTSITALSQTIRQKEHEINTLRGQVAALNRNLESTQQQRDSAQKDAETFKARVTALTSSVARLREDYNAQSLALREARSFAASFSNLAMQSPRPGTQGAASPNNKEANLAKSPSISKPRTTAGDSMSPVRTNKGGSASSPGGKSSIQALAAALKSQDKRGTSENRTGGKEDAVLQELREEYEELKNCFLMLCPLVPNGETAREVATGVVAGVDKLNARIAALEKEIKKKTIALQTEKKDSAALKDQISSMQKKSDLADDLIRRVDEKDRTTEKAKRMLEVAHKDHERTRQEANQEKATLEEELQGVKSQLAQAKQELAEGREMMIALLKEDESALKESERIMTHDGESDV